jgi:hypothetical protein
MVSWFRQERLYAASCYILLMELLSVLFNFVSECKAHVRMQVVVDTLGSKEKRHFAILFDRHQLILLLVYTGGFLQNVGEIGISSSW